MAEKRNALDVLMQNARAKKPSGAKPAAAAASGRAPSVSSSKKAKGTDKEEGSSSKKAKGDDNVEVKEEGFNPKKAKADDKVVVNEEGSHPKRGKADDEVEVKEEGASSKKAKAKDNEEGSARVGAVGAKMKDPLPTGGDDAIAELMKKQAEFEPKKAAFWNDGEHVPFLFLARALDLIANESGRLIITEILCNVFRTVIATTPRDLLPVVYLSANKIAPAHDGVELGIGDAAIIKTLAEAFGRKEDQIKSQLKVSPPKFNMYDFPQSLGDLGLVAKASRSKQQLLAKPERLTCTRVLDSFRFIAKESGNQSQDKKRARMKALLVAANDCEPQYLVRLLQAKMRIGLAEQTVLVALGHAAALSEQPPILSSKLQSRLEEAGQIMKHTHSVLPIYDRIIPALLENGIQKLPQVCAFTVGVPVGPMLAKPTKGVTEVLNKFQDLKFTCEYKYDGVRAQVHYMDDGTVEVYSRNAERNTEKFPDVVALMSRMKMPEVTSFVLDCEVVAFDKKTEKILPFQVLSTRNKKGVVVSEITVQVCIFAFDMLYINGRNLLEEQLIVRREELYKSFNEAKGQFLFATAKNTCELEEMQGFLNDAVNDSCEGLIVKTLDTDATYEPAKRSHNWLKLKKDYMDTVGDSLDLVPIGGFFGKGKRTGVYGSFLLACYDEDSEHYQSICKIGTGFSEAELELRSTSLNNHIIDKPRSYYQIGSALGVDVDVWFDPVEVWEVKAADLTLSSTYHAANGLVDSTKSISLRFPRLLKLREDKKPEQATTSEQVADMYRAQNISHVTEQGDDDEDD